MNDTLCLQLRWQRPGFELDVNVSVAAQGVTMLWGPSGSGKTTLMRCVAGLERASGRVAIGREIWQDDAGHRFVPVWQRRLGYVFQEPSLFDHLSVAGNLRYGLQRSAAPHDTLALEQAVAVLGIGHLLTRWPATLSGGERQRVAIARALAAQPRLLLLDEPLAALDPARKQEVLPWLDRLRAELQVPVLYITHSADEVARLADTLVLLADGRVHASGPVAELLASGSAPLALGDDVGTLLLGRVTERDPGWGQVRVAVPGGDVWVADRGSEIGAHARLHVLARDVSVTLTKIEGSSIPNTLQGVVRSIDPLPHAAGTDGHPVLVRIDCAGSVVLARLAARAAHRLQLRPGLSVWVQIHSAHFLG